MHRVRARGFTYLGLIILVAIMALVGAAGLKMGTLLQRAAAEEELLEIGNQFSEALRSYAAATPQGQAQQPPSLQDLLRDPRFPNPRRHLRKIFVDPVTGKAEWGIVYLGDKVGVLGVYSLSTLRPLKVANFDIRFANMENRDHLSDWKFLMAGGAGVAPAVFTPPNSMSGPPSLFQPPAGAAGGDGKGGAPAPGGPKAGDGPALGGQPMEPPVEQVMPPADSAAEPAQPEQGQPMEVPPQEDKPADGDDKGKDEPPAVPADPVPTVSPPHKGRR